MYKESRYREITAFLLVEPRFEGWEDGPRSGEEPGCGSTPLRLRSGNSSPYRWEDGPRLLTLKGVKDLGLSSNPIHPGSCLDLGPSSYPPILVWRAESSHILVQNPLISHISHLKSHLQQTILILYCSIINRRLINIMTTLP